MRFSLSFFSTLDDAESADRYGLVLEAARFADENGFTAVWVPERHFQPFGGLFPNPSVIGAALAMVTRRVGIRAGSVVLPNQNPLRVAEEWAAVDCLSGGRVGIAFAAGWHPNDFVISPDNFEKRRELMYERIPTFTRLWRGEPVACRNGAGEEVSVLTYPRPVQRDVPLWLTAARDVEIFRRAGAMGMNVLTYLVGHTPAELAEKIAEYRKARAESGHDPDGGQVTVTIHAFLGEDLEEVRQRVREPFIRYLRSFMNLMDAYVRGARKDLDPSAISPRWIDYMLENAFERHFRTSTLLGTVESCSERVAALAKIGVTELACLVDFGVERELVLERLPHLARLAEQHA